MKESNSDGLQTSVTIDETPDQNNQDNGGLARRQFLGAAAVAVSVTASSGKSEDDKSESFKGTVEWKASGV